jgi:hypothetical protein
MYHIAIKSTYSEVSQSYVKVRVIGVFRHFQQYRDYQTY